MMLGVELARLFDEGEDGGRRDALIRGAARKVKGLP
jgi:hypothetical protein